MSKMMHDQPSAAVPASRDRRNFLIAGAGLALAATTLGRSGAVMAKPAGQICAVVGPSQKHHSGSVRAGLGNGPAALDCPNPGYDAISAPDRKQRRTASPVDGQRATRNFNVSQASLVLEGIVFDRNNNLLFVDVATGRVFKLTSS